MKKGEYYICKRAAMTPAPDMEGAKLLISQQDFPGNWIVVKVKAVPTPRVAAMRWDDPE